MRLIDADNFLERFEKMCKTETEIIIVSILRGVLIDEPTAYSVDKVVEELEENASRYTKKYTTPYGNNGYRDTKAISIHKAIEIVKQGGVDDDVCEWNGEQSRLVTYTNFTTACGYSFDLQTNNELLKAFRYCPFCGKKIKVVE